MLEQIREGVGNKHIFRWMIYLYVFIDVVKTRNVWGPIANY